MRRHLTPRIRSLAVSLLVLACGALPAAAQGPSNAVVEYYHLDAIGSVRAVTDATGAVVRRHDYFPFGEEAAPPPGADQLRFAGKARDGETGLDYFGARYYGPSTGRMMTVDPIVNVNASVLDPQQWNRYAYARNSPLTYIDPTGAAIELIGSSSDREATLELLRGAVGRAGEYLYINEVEVDGTRRYFVGIRGDVARFMSINPSAHTLANLITHESIVEFQLTTSDLGRFGGAVTYEPGEAGNANTRVLVNGSQVRFALSPSTLIGRSRFEAGSAIRPLTPEIAAWHEFGHAWGYIQGRPLKYTNPEALQWENLMRAMTYGPFGPRNARRIKH